MSGERLDNLIVLATEKNLSDKIVSKSGSGKIVLEFYDELVKIWGGSPATEPFSCGTCSEKFDDEDSDVIIDDPVTKVSNCFLICTYCNL